MQPVTIDDLKGVFAFNDLPAEHLQWILDHVWSAAEELNL